MKQLFFGMAAVVLAAAGAAFTTPVSTAANLADAFFQFDYNTYLPTTANVEDESKWVRVTDMNGCTTDDERACKIRVTTDHYSGNTLLSSTDIQAQESASGIAFVASAEAEEIVNKANP